MSTLEDLVSGRMEGARELRLSEGLEEVPEEVLGLAETLEILDLSGNRLRDLPKELERMRRLRIVFFSGNEFEHLPEVLGSLPELEMVGFKSNRIATVSAASLPERLRWLILTDNRLRELPAALGSRRRLQKLMLAGNLLETLPDLSDCQALELVRLSANRLASLPDWLFELPRLAWLAYSGNPFCQPRLEVPLEAIPWSRLELREVLGEGASGRIHRAALDSPMGGASHIAVKIFKGSVTSDGYPHDERAAFLAAGTHPHLIPILGPVAGHPEGRDAVAMELVPSGFRNLAGPPSYASCTRDVFPEGERFEPQVAAAILSGSTSLLEHLHARGLCHGDFYAHNVLVDESGHPLLGDFGAAGFLGDLPAHQREAMIRIEHRALAALREDIETRLGDSVGN